MVQFHLDFRLQKHCLLIFRKTIITILLQGKNESTLFLITATLVLLKNNLELLYSFEKLRSCQAREAYQTLKKNVTYSTASLESRHIFEKKNNLTKIKESCKNYHHIAMLIESKCHQIAVCC